MSEDSAHDQHQTTNTKMVLSDGTTIETVGFTSNLLSSLMSSRAKLDAFCSANKARAESVSESNDVLVTEKQAEVDALSHELERIRIKRGIAADIDQNENTRIENNSHDSNDNNNSSCGIAAKRIDLREQQTQIENNRLDLQKTEKLIERELVELSKQESQYRIKAEEARRAKQAVEEMKQTTINDLTKGVLNYNRLGMKFESERNRLRIAFTLIDPNTPQRLFSFTLFVNSGNLYEVDDCNPPLKAGTIFKLVEDLNTSGHEFSLFVRKMREYFPFGLTSYSFALQLGNDKEGFYRAFLHVTYAHLTKSRPIRVYSHIFFTGKAFKENI